MTLNECFIDIEHEWGSHCSMISEFFKPKEWFLNLFQKHYYMIFENYYTKYDGRSAKIWQKIVKITNYVALNNAPLKKSGALSNATWFWSFDEFFVTFRIFPGNCSTEIY